MSIHRLIVASTVSAMGLFAAAPAGANDAAPAKGGQCEARVVRAQTEFPKSAQDRGLGGVVRVQIVLNAEGRVVQSKVVGSSGSHLLDKAAEKSVGTDWQFDVGHCIASSLPTAQEVSVVYRRVPNTFSAGINRRGLAKVRQAAVDKACSVVPVDSGSHVISCIQRPAADGLAAR